LSIESLWWKQILEVATNDEASDEEASGDEASGDEASSDEASGDEASYYFIHHHHNIQSLITVLLKLPSAGNTKLVTSKTSLSAPLGGGKQHCGP
jgi:hypothetical protein